MKSKQLTNFLSSLGRRHSPHPPRRLEQAIAYVQDDDLVDVTPRVIGIRKRFLIRMRGSGKAGERKRLSL